MKLKKVLSLACAALLCTASVSADGINAVFDKSTRELAVSGELGDKSSNSRVVVLIAKESTELPEIADGDYESGVGGAVGGVENIFQVKSDANGNYTAETVSEPTAGKLAIYVSSDNMENYVKQTVFIPTKSAVDEFTGKIQSASNAGDIASCLSAEEKAQSDGSDSAFGANLKWYEYLNAAGRATVAQNVYAEKKNGKYTGGDAAQKIDNDIYIYSYLAYLSQIDSADELIKVFDISQSGYSTNDKVLISKMLGLDAEYQNSMFTFLNSTADDIKTAVSEAAAVRDITTADKLKDAIYVSVLNYKFSEKYSNGWRDAYRILKEHSDVLPSMSTGKLDANESNQKMFASIISKTYDTTAQICDAVNTWSDSGTDGGSSGGGGGGKTSSKTGSGSITTTMPIIPPPVSTPFDDLANHEWARTAIEALYKRGVVNGTGGKTYNPDGEVKREEFVKIIVSALGISAADKQVQFTDNVLGSWYTDYVNTAASAGIINGMGDGSFGVGRSITRQDVAVIVCNALSNAGVMLSPSDDTFADDAEISGYAKDKVMSLYALGLVSGRGNGRFAPQEYMTRAETAVLVYNMLNMFAR